MKWWGILLVLAVVLAVAWFFGLLQPVLGAFDAFLRWLGRQW
jgi:hypothetical protein